MNNGLFVTLEGIEGTGKTTQREEIYKHFSAIGLNVVQTREPGGTPQAEKIRDLLLTPNDEELSAKCESLLFYASREQHLNGVIRPSLATGALVICDRFADTTEAYQMAGGKMDQGFINDLRKHIVGETEPDLVFVLVMDVEKAFQRAAARGALNRMESKGMEYYQAAQEQFVKLAHTPHPTTTYSIIDADQPAEVISQQIIREVTDAWERKQTANNALFPLNNLKG